MTGTSERIQPQNATGRFSGRVAFVTGAGSGIGRATAERLATDGASVVCMDINGAAVQAVADGLPPSQVLACTVDVRSRKELDRAVSEGLVRFGRADYLVNSAGVVTMIGLAGLTESDWDFVLDINLKGVFLATQVVAPAIARTGGGAIVNLSTIEAEVVVASGPSCQPHYNASKGGVRMLTKALAHELASANIRVNAVAPGPVATSFAGIDYETPVAREFLARRMLIPRAALPSEVASAVAFLLSDDASFITGIQLPVDGGWLVH